jgi:5-methylcytosine-specific restriction enzyme subunit McrC
MIVQSRSTRRHLTVAEHDVVPVGSEPAAGHLSFAEAEALLRLAEKRRGFCERGYRSIRFAQHCGVVNLGGRVIEIVPKVGAGGDVVRGRDIMLRLLHASGALQALRFEVAGQAMSRAPLLDLFLLAFFDSVLALARGGLLRQYLAREEDLRVVRGQIHYRRQFGTHFNRPDIVAARYDDLTADNAWNRSIKAALKVCRPWITTGEAHRRWVELYAALDDVTETAITVTEVDRLVYDRQAARYRNAMAWVRWILQLLSPTLRAGSAEAPAFLFDMNVIFERVAGRILRREIQRSRPDLTVQLGGGSRHLARTPDASGRKAFALKPDILVREGQSLRMIADAKWKRVEIHPSGRVRPNRADMYQMHAYATGYGVDELALIYPADSEAAHARPTRYVLETGGRQTRVAVLLVDVERDGLPLHGIEPLFS